MLKAPQVQHILADSGASVLITNSMRAGSVRESVNGQLPIPVISIDGTESSVSWGELLQNEQEFQIDSQESDIAAILYTSGSTGRPKGVVLSQANLAIGAESVAAYLNNTRDDVILSAHYAPASPYHTGIIISTDMGKTWAQYDLKQFGRRSPVRIQKKNSDGWFRIDLRTGWIGRGEVLFIKPKPSDS